MSPAAACRLPRHQAHPLWDRAASIGWRLTPVSLFGAYAILQAVFIVTGIVMLALRLGGEPARQSAAWFNSLGIGLNDLAPIGLPTLGSVLPINWGSVLFLVLMAVIGLLYWSWLATWLTCQPRLPPCFCSWWRWLHCYCGRPRAPPPA